MYIHEAVEEAEKIDGSITGGFSEGTENVLFLKPTDTSERCILFIDEKHSCRGWEPRASELSSDKWQVVTKEDFLTLSKKNKLF